MSVVYLYRVLLTYHAMLCIDLGTDVKIMDRFFRHREVPDSEKFSTPGFQLKTASYQLVPITRVMLTPFGIGIIRRHF